MSIYTEDLIASAKLRSFAPFSQTAFGTSDFIRIGNEELLFKLAGDIFKKREDFFLTYKDVAITAGVQRITVPMRAIGNTFRSLWFVENDVVKYALEMGNESDYSTYSGLQGAPEKFLIEGDEVILLPTPSASAGSIRFRYYAKPNLLVETSSCAKITSVSSLSGTTTFVVDTDLTSSLSVGSTIDFLSSKSPFLLWADQVEITAISSTEIQVATDDVSDAVGTVEPQANDYICPFGYSNIPMVPYEFHPVLAQMIAVRMLAGLGDIPKLTVASQILEQMRTEVLGIISNRVETSPRVLASQWG